LGVPGLTAKVFRTHHATIAVQRVLEDSGVGAGDPEYRKWEAASLANLEAAVLCNHTKMEAASWPRSRQRFRERRQKAEQRVQTHEDRIAGYREAFAALRHEAEEKEQAAPTPARKEKVRLRYEKRFGVAERRLQRAQVQLDRAQLALGKIDAQASIAAQKRTWNLGTSLKSYIDPRVYFHWGQQVEYDVLERYYPKALRSKFAWVRNDSEGESGGEPG
jgi:DNA topoisomerase-1